MFSLFSWRVGVDALRNWMVRFGEALQKHEDHQGENTIPRPLAGAAKIIETGNQTVSLKYWDDFFYPDDDNDLIVVRGVMRRLLLFDERIVEYPIVDG